MTMCYRCGRATLDLLEWMKDQKTLHRKYLFKVNGAPALGKCFSVG